MIIDKIKNRVAKLEALEFEIESIKLRFKGSTVRVRYNLVDLFTGKETYKVQHLRWI